MIGTNACRRVVQMMPIVVLARSAMIGTNACRRVVQMMPIVVLARSAILLLASAGRRMRVVQLIRIVTGGRSVLVANARRRVRNLLRGMVLENSMCKNGKCQYLSLVSMTCSLSFVVLK